MSLVQMPNPDNLPTDADEVEFAANVIGQAGYNFISDAKDWLEAFKALTAAKAKAAKQAV